MSPPSDAFMAVLERQLSIATLVVCSWAWSCLGIKLASLARRETVLDASLEVIDTGRYIEVVVSIQANRA